MWVADKINKVKDAIAIKSAFKHDKRSIEIQVIKGDRSVQIAIYDEDKNCFFLLKERNIILKSDLIVDVRNQLFKVIKVDENSNVEITIEGNKQQVEVIAVYCEEYHIDNSLFEIVNRQEQTIYQVLNINIESIKGSTIDNFASMNASNNAKQNIVNKWSTIRRELEWRFDYRDHRKYIESVDEVISMEDSKLIDEKAKEKTIKLLGGFLGELIGTFTTRLIEYFRNR